MAPKRDELPDLQRELLEAAVQARGGRIWLPKDAPDTLPTTYSALVRLTKRKLIEVQPTKDAGVMSWKITKAGREALAAKTKRKAG